MKHVKRNIIVFGAVAIVLLMVSSVTAVEQTNSEPMMDYIEGQEQTGSEELNYLNNCMSGDVGDDILNLYLEKVPYTNILNNFFTNDEFLDFLDNNQYVAAFMDKVEDMFGPGSILDEYLDGLASQWVGNGGSMSDKSFVGYSMTAIKWTIKTFSEEDEYSNLKDCDEVQLFTTKLKTKLRNAGLLEEVYSENMQASSETMTMVSGTENSMEQTLYATGLEALLQGSQASSEEVVKTTAGEDESKTLSGVDSAFADLVINEIDTLSTGDTLYDFLVRLAAAIIFLEKVIFKNMPIPFLFTKALIAVIIFIPALLLTSDVETAIVAFFAVIIGPWIPIIEFCKESGLFGILVLMLAVIWTPIILPIQLIVAFLVFILVLLFTINVPEAWQIIRDIIEEAELIVLEEPANRAEVLYEKYFGDDGNNAAVNGGSTSHQSSQPANI